MSTWIITVGNEVLNGKVVNTNASWIAQKLTNLGINIKRVVVVPDKIEDIIEVVREGLDKSEIIILTGGLGPTHDDITNIALAKALNRELVINEDAYKEIKEKYEKMGLPLTEERIKMSKMPKNSLSLSNPIGTAPAILIKIKGKLIIALPGVPSEMKAIFEKHLPKYLAPFIKEYYHESSLVIAGIPESEVAPILKKIQNQHPNIYIKSHPKGIELGEAKLEIHLSAKGTKKDELIEEIETVKKEIKKELSIMK